MKLKNILTLDCTLCAIPATSKKRILEQICALAANHVKNMNSEQLLESLLEREKMGSTGIGNGIAIPHGRLPASEDGHTQPAVAVLLTTDQAIDFDAIDNRGVDVFISLFVSENNCQEHLCTLQSIAQLFGDRKISKQVRKCQTNQELFDLIQAEMSD